MAMMMTGRVLLVCGLCVLWCGVCGGLADEETAGSGSGAELPLGSKGLKTSPQDPQGSQNRAPGGKENITPVPIEEADDDDDDDEDDDDDDDDEDDDGETKAEEERSTERQSVQEGAAAPDPGSREENLSGSGQEKVQSILSAEDISHSNSQESNANATQTEFEKKNTDENKPAVEDALTTGNGGNTLPEGIAEGNFPSSPEDGVDSRKQDGEETTSEGTKNFQSPATAATPQSHRDKGSEGTGEDTKATTLTANKTDTTNTQNSDSSTAVSHTTSPRLLLLLVVACAAAAAVVAA
ncbi:Mucin-associated surface protein (MASP), subgroup S002 [Trypanosoma cruzi]|nr:Mucin-associated surface protein (MASP), subgroup S002 [Trypanosoma cruzi]